MNGEHDPTSDDPREWATSEHVETYLERADEIPHRAEGVSALLEEVPGAARRVLDLGTGDGRLLELVLSRAPDASGVAVDFSPPMLEASRARFAQNESVNVIAHDLDAPLPVLGSFDVVCSSFAIHHVTHERKRILYGEILERLEPGGVFLNLEHVASPTPWLHERFLERMGLTRDDEDPSNKLLDVGTQLRWLWELGYAHVDCLWKWRELALLSGRRREA